MKHTFKINFFGWLLCLSMAFWLTSCQEPNEQLTETPSLQEDVTYKVTSLKELPEIQPIINNIKRLSKSSTVLAKGETYLGVDSVLVDKVIQITKDGYSAFTFGIYTDFENSKYVENLHLIEFDSGYVAFILRYETPDGWDEDEINKTPEGDLVLNPANFEGYITKYTLDRQIIWTSNPSLLSRTTWVDVCFTHIYAWCDRDGTLHPATSNCTGNITYTRETVCIPALYLDESDEGTDGITVSGEPTSGGGGTNGSTSSNELTCTNVLGTIIQNGGVSSFNGEACTIDPGIKLDVEDLNCTKLKNLINKPVSNQNPLENVGTLLNQLQDSTSTTTKEMLYFLNPLDETESQFENYYFEGAENADEVIVDFGTNAVSVLMHLHYNNEAEDKKQLSVFSLQDIYEMYHFIGTGNIFSPHTFTNFLTTENGTNYAIQINDSNAFINSSFALKYFIGWEFDNIKDDAENRYGKDLYNILPDNTNGQNELAFTKFLANENLGLTLFRANNDFTEFTKIEYKNGTFTETPCN